MKRRLRARELLIGVEGLALAARLVPDAAGAAYLGLPGVLIWDLVRA
jgi:hypothetical protein